MCVLIFALDVLPTLSHVTPSVLFNGKCPVKIGSPVNWDGADESEAMKTR